MENRYQYSLDDLPPLLYMADDDGCQVSTDAHGHFPHGTEYDGVVELSKITNNYSVNNQHYKEFIDEIDFHLPASSSTIEDHSASPSGEPQLSTAQPSLPKVRKKKPQECNRCANHDISVLIKGHKYYCPYINCSCELCEVTQKKNYYAKLQQKMNRNRQGHEKVPQTGYAPKMLYEEYPESRRQELVNDLNDTKLDVLDGIKDLCTREKKA